jgi:hypothetical protein
MLPLSPSYFHPAYLSRLEDLFSEQKNDLSRLSISFFFAKIPTIPKTDSLLFCFPQRKVRIGEKNNIAYIAQKILNNTFSGAAETLLFSLLQKSNKAHSRT